MNQILAVALGGALGALARYGLVGLVHTFASRNFPYGTFAVNILGSFLIGISYILVVEKLHLAAHWHAIIMVGFIGAFTTFSTFSLEALVLLQEGRPLPALVYVLASVLLCIAATALGMLSARQLF